MLDALSDQIKKSLARCGPGAFAIPGLLKIEKKRVPARKAKRVGDKVLLCASKASLTSWWVKRELDTAFEKEMKLSKKRAKKKRRSDPLAIVPLNLDGHLFKWDGPHAAALRKRLAADFTAWETDNSKFEAQFELLVKALQTKDSGHEPAPKPKL